MSPNKRDHCPVQGYSGQSTATVIKLQTWKTFIRPKSINDS